MNHLVSIGERLREERVRLGLSQTAFGELGGVTKKTQMLYEGGERAADSAYLAAVASSGVDVRYVVTGHRDAPAQDLPSPEEQLVLRYYREAPVPVRKAAMAALLSSAPSGVSLRMKGGEGNVQIGGSVSGESNFKKGK